MARMHSGAKGVAGSKKPAVKQQPVWLRYSEKEVELLIQKLAKEGMSASKIGLHLRDVYGIPDLSVITTKKITGILKEKNLAPKMPEDLRALFKKNAQLMKHFELNKHDVPAKRSIFLTESKIRRLVKYYKRSGAIAKTWNYNPADLKFYLE